MKEPCGTLYSSRNWEVDYHKGHLILCELEHHDYYTIQIKDAWTGQNTTTFKFKQEVQKFGLDKACERFMRMSPEYKANLNINFNTLEVA